MTYVDWETAKAAAKEFRNYDLEWEFIKAMDCLGELKYEHGIVVQCQDAQMIGFVWVLVWESCNDNTLGTI